MNELYAKRLADLILTKGVDLQKGQCLLINTTPTVYEYARRVAEEAYRKGAKYVELTVSDDRLTAARANSQCDEHLDFVASYKESLYNEAIEEEWALLWIESSDNSLQLPDYDSARFQRIRNAERKVRKRLTDIFSADKLPWCVTCAPDKAWAESLLGEGKTEDDLWEVLAKVLRIDREDYIEAWDEFSRKSRERLAKLNSLKIKRLHYTSPNTDLYIGLRENAIFQGADAGLPDGRRFFPNLPTEEIFTTPDYDKTEGYVTTTRPVTVMGKRTENVRLTFTNGKVVKCEAEVGQEVMDTYLAIDEGARMLGEAALVAVDSPISESRLVFDSILIDENASCHIALGAGYPTCVKGAEALTEDTELKRMGVNTSLVHTDFMVGDENLDIEAECFDGSMVMIMKSGKFTF